MRRMRALLLLSGAVLSGTALAAQAPARITAAGFLAHVRHLASDEMAGRGNGTAALEHAAEYIATSLRTAGLQGAGDANSFFQAFTAEVRIEPPATAAMTISAPGGQQTFALGNGYVPLSRRDAPEPPPELRDLPVVFAGYGISAAALHYDDFASVDVRGAAVLVFTHEPQEEDEGSPFAGRSLTPGAAVSAKAREAGTRGARMLMVIEDPAHVDDSAMPVAWWRDSLSEASSIPVVHLNRRQLARALPDLDFTQLAEGIDLTLQPQSRRLQGITVAYIDHRAQFTAPLRNVVGLLPGSDPALADEAVVVGAHYDHVGTGGELSDLPESTGEIHNGADDNASGIAALLEMARSASRSRARFGRTVIFAAFAGEELGLRGSAHYVAHPAWPVERTAAMINLDMIGRAQGRVMVGVFGPSPLLPSLAARLRPWTRLLVHDFGSAGGYDQEASDVASFAARGVPAVAFFTGFHPDYHRPSDDWPRVDAEGGAEIARLALRLVEVLSRQKTSTGR